MTNIIHIIRKKILYFPFLAIGPLISLNTQGADIVFDLGGVLLRTPTSNSMIIIRSLVKDGFAQGLRQGVWNIGSIIKYVFHNKHHIEKYTKHKLYEILNKEEVCNTFTKLPHNSYKTSDNHGVPMPRLMYAWVVGDISDKEITSTLIPLIDNHQEWFSCTIEQKLIRTIVLYIFTPEIFASHVILASESIDLIKACKNKGHRVFILSNFNPSSFALLQAKYADFFNLFDGIIISGELHCAKPDKKIYEKLLKKYDINTKQCVFIDDQKENLDEAKKSFGIHPIHCTQKPTPFFFGINSKPNLTEVHHALNMWEQNNCNKKK